MTPVLRPRPCFLFLRRNRVFFLFVARLLSFHSDQLDLLDYSLVARVVLASTMLWWLDWEKDLHERWTATACAIATASLCIFPGSIRFWVWPTLFYKEIKAQMAAVPFFKNIFVMSFLVPVASATVKGINPAFVLEYLLSELHWDFNDACTYDSRAGIVTVTKYLSRWHLLALSAAAALAFNPGWAIAAAAIDRGYCLDRHYGYTGVRWSLAAYLMVIAVVLGRFPVLNLLEAPALVRLPLIRFFWISL